MKAIIQSISLAICTITAVSVVVFGANYGINEYESYKTAFQIVATVSGLSILAVVFVIITKIYDDKI